MLIAFFNYDTVNMTWYEMSSDSIFTCAAIRRMLCLRQLRYSGMMETIRIRRAGYPTRHLFYDFVERYRILVRGVRPPHMEDCQAATRKICQAVFGQSDYQIGMQKYF